MRRKRWGRGTEEGAHVDAGVGSGSGEARLPLLCGARSLVVDVYATHKKRFISLFIFNTPKIIIIKIKRIIIITS
jgi:hypothetical protein